MTIPSKAKFGKFNCWEVGKLKMVSWLNLHISLTEIDEHLKLSEVIESRDMQKIGLL